tara:strand:- start:1315 stop:1782 length:468 start_codon:yes stop_codon:yes gene_type:complete
MKFVKNLHKNLDNLIKVKFNKITILVFVMFLFSFIYMLLDDSHFSGVNKFKEIVKEEVIKDKAKKKIQENYTGLNNLNKENIIDSVAKETEKAAVEEELNPNNVEPSFIKRYFNRLYFAIVTGCLLGYGDIYPVSNLSKLLCGIQGLFTVALIIY